MLEHIDPTTVLFCRFIVMMIWGCAMAVALLSNRSERAPIYWLGTIFSLMLGDAQEITGFISDDLYGRRIEFVFYSSVFICTWLGFRSFAGKTTPIGKCLALLAAFVLMIVISDGMIKDVILKYRIDATVDAVIGVLFCLGIVTTLLAERVNRQLPMAWLSACVYMLGAISMASDLYMSIFDPLQFRGRMILSDGLTFDIIQDFVLVTISAMTAILLLKERSEQRYRIISETDPLTGIANRRAFVTHVEKQLANAAPYFTMAIVDLDHFKSVNDTYGHQAGDEVLTAFTKLATELLPEDSCFGRIGGEEFGIFLPNSGKSNAHTLEVLRHRTETLDFSFQGRRIPITVSIGAATVEAAGAGFDTLVAAADRALYLAKEKGRNQVNMLTSSQQLQMILAKSLKRPEGAAGACRKVMTSS